LPCPKCNLIIDDLNYKELKRKDSKAMSQQKNIDQMLKAHNGEPCITEAIPEANGI
jgi:hypothetical protein